MRLIASGFCCVALFTAAGVASAASLSSADKNFMTTAARTDMTEAHEGQMAANQALRADIKDLAKMAVDDHTQSYERLTELAAKIGVRIPKGISGRSLAIQQLVHLKGTNFDRQYAKDETASERQTLALFKHEAAHGQNADVKAYASQEIPVLEKILQTAAQTTKPVKKA